MTDPRLDRLVPPDFSHVEKFPLSALPAEERPRGVPVVIGINWYAEFDQPQQDRNGRWWVAADGNLTTVRGGHCLCVKPEEPDFKSWWQFYNQGNEGACVGFGNSRMMSLLNKVEYDAFELYHATQALGGYVGQEGAYVRDALAVLSTRGPIRNGEAAARSEDGISAYRWATSLDEVHEVLNMPLARQLGGIPLLNSWGLEYPHIVWMPDEVADRVLFHEDGEVGIVTDR